MTSDLLISLKSKFLNYKWIKFDYFFVSFNGSQAFKSETDTLYCKLSFGYFSFIQGVRALNSFFKIGM